MQKRGIIALLISCMLYILMPTIALAGGGIALSNPPVSSITIDRFPFHYENAIRVYNTGDEVCVFAIKVITEYQDVAEWISFDKDIFVLEPETNTQCTFYIDANEGYTGNYEVVLFPVLLPKEAMEMKRGGTGVLTYISVGIEFQFTIRVPREVGDKSLGDRPPLPEVTPEPKPEPEKPVEEGGVVWKDIGKPIVLNIPAAVYQNETVELSASFIGGGEPADMGLLIVSPSGEEYELPRSTTFKFNEVGQWSIIVTIGGEMILGQPLEVVARPVALTVSWAVLGRIIGVVLIIISVIVSVILVRRRRALRSLGQR